MRIVFFGSSDFAAVSLKRLIAGGHQVVTVVTQPDKKKGRGMHLLPTSVKVLAQESEVNVFQPADVNTADSVAFLRRLAADVFAVVAYGQILSNKLLEIPSMGCINLHASLLPAYRGASPINRAIINGDTLTGVTIMQMTERMDAGPIILKQACPISADDTALSLGERLAQLGAGALLVSLEQIRDGTMQASAQDESQATYAYKLKKQDGCIDWQKEAGCLHNMVRGVYPWPGAYTDYQGVLLKIFRTKGVVCRDAQQPPACPGTIVGLSSHGMTVTCGRDCLVVEEVQLAGGCRMPVGRFIAGHRIKIGEVLGRK